MSVSIADVFLANQKRKLMEIRHRMEWVICQLTDEDANWRPNAQSNSVADLIIHICGNIIKRYITGLNGAFDTRNKDSEFSVEHFHTVPDSLQMLANSFNNVDSILTSLNSEQLLSL